VDLGKRVSYFASLSEGGEPLFIISQGEESKKPKKKNASSATKGGPSHYLSSKWEARKKNLLLRIRGRTGVLPLKEERKKNGRAPTHAPPTMEGGRDAGRWRLSKEKGDTAGAASAFLEGKGEKGGQESSSFFFADEGGSRKKERIGAAKSAPAS